VGRAVFLGCAVSQERRSVGFSSSRHEGEQLGDAKQVVRASMAEPPLRPVLCATCGVAFSARLASTKPRVS
jgi:hypothetical protein